MKRKQKLETGARRTCWLLRPVERIVDHFYDRRTQKLVDRAFRVVRRDRHERINRTPA